MQLIEFLPDLAEDEGQFWTHRSGGEHAPKYIGAEAGYNPLRADWLRTLGGEVPEPIGHETFAEMLLDSNVEVIIVDRYDLPEGAQGVVGVVAGAIAERAKTGQFEKVVTMKEMVVHPELRLHGVASYMLDRAAASEVYGAGEATELVVDTSEFQLDDGFRSKLVQAGFKHTNEQGAPALWLPGNTIYQGDRDDPVVVEKLLAAMPANWNGYHTFYPDSDLQFQVFRHGKLIGVARPDKESARFREHGYVYDFGLTDASHNELDNLTGLTERQAMIALLNNYQLID